MSIAGKAESNGVPGKVLITESCRDHLPASWRFEQTEVILETEEGLKSKTYILQDQ